jgi:hypothetical protein
VPWGERVGVVDAAESATHESITTEARSIDWIADMGWRVLVAIEWVYADR